MKPPSHSSDEKLLFPRKNIIWYELYPELAWIEIYERQDCMCTCISLYVREKEIYRLDLVPGEEHCHWNVHLTGNLRSKRMMFLPLGKEAAIERGMFDIEHNYYWGMSWSGIPVVSMCPRTLREGVIWIREELARGKNR